MVSDIFECKKALLLPFINKPPQVSGTRSVIQITLRNWNPFRRYNWRFPSQTEMTKTNRFITAILSLRQNRVGDRWFRQSLPLIYLSEHYQLSFSPRKRISIIATLLLVEFFNFVSSLNWFLDSNSCFYSWNSKCIRRTVVAGWKGTFVVQYRLLLMLTAFHTCSSWIECWSMPDFSREQNACNIHFYQSAIW